MALWSFVYIVAAKNGIGISSILYGFWFLSTVIFLIQGPIKVPNVKTRFVFLFATAGLLIILCFAFLQTKVNPGWGSLIDDVKISVQIDRYPNWQNPGLIGYPKRKDGQTVTPNTYERVAWATAGSRAILGYPAGVGILSFPFAMHPNPPANMPTGQGALGIATHSGWVELGLAFGIPILTLIFSALLLSFVNAVRGGYPAKMTILGFVILIFCLYTVGEVAVDHGLEILFFFLALLPALMLTNPRQTSGD